MLVIILFTSGAPTAQAYDDDTHYHLTYYLARLTGYTPEQAYRIASANVGIDYAPESEPVQMTARLQEAYLKEDLASAKDAQVPLIYTHAFMDCRNNPDCLVDPSERAAALSVLDSATKQFGSQAMSSRNFGAYLHFFQDKYAHVGYSSWGGHWPISDRRNLTMTLKHLTGEKPLGSVADYLSHVPPEYAKNPKTREEEMIDGTLSFMFDYLSTNLPHQKVDAKKLGAASSEARSILATLRSVNKAPDPLVVKDAKIFAELLSRKPPMASYVEYVKWTYEVLSVIGSRYLGLGIKEPPNAKRAYDAVRDAVRPIEPEYWEGDYPPSFNPVFKSFNRLGAYTGDPDPFTLYGDLRVASVTEVREGKKVPAEKVSVRVTLGPVRTSDKDGTSLPEKPYARRGLVFEKLPVGKVKVEVLRDNKAVWSQEIKLLKVEETLAIDLSDEESSVSKSDVDIKLQSLRDALARIAEKQKKLEALCGEAKELAGRVEASVAAALARTAALESEIAPKISSMQQKAGEIAGVKTKADGALSEAQETSKRAEFLSIKACAQIAEILQRGDTSVQGLKKITEDTEKSLQESQQSITAAIQTIESYIAQADAGIAAIEALEQEVWPPFRAAEVELRTGIEGAKNALFTLGGLIGEMQANAASVRALIEEVRSLSTRISALNTAALNEDKDYKTTYNDVLRELGEAEKETKNIESKLGCADEMSKESARLDKHIQEGEDALLKVREDFNKYIAASRTDRAATSAVLDQIRPFLSSIEESHKRLGACVEGSDEAIKDPVGHALSRCDFELAEQIAAVIPDTEERKAALEKIEVAKKKEEKTRQLEAEADRLYHAPGYDAALAKLREARALTVCPDRQSELDEKIRSVENERLFHQSLIASLSGPCDFLRANSFLEYLKARKPREEAVQLLKERKESDKKTNAELAKIDALFNEGRFDEALKILEAQKTLDEPCKNHADTIDYWNDQIRSEAAFVASAKGALESCDFGAAEGHVQNITARQPKSELSRQLSERKENEKAQLDKVSQAAKLYQEGSFDASIAILEPACAGFTCEKYTGKCAEKLAKVREQKGIYENILAALADCRFEKAEELLAGFEPKGPKETLSRRVAEAKDREKNTFKLAKEAADAAHAGEFDKSEGLLRQAESASSCDRLKEQVQEKIAKVREQKTVYTEGLAAVESCDLSTAENAASRLTFKTPHADLEKKISQARSKLDKLRSKTAMMNSSLNNLLQKSGSDQVSDEALWREADKREGELQQALQEASTSAGCAHQANEIVKDTLEMIRRARTGGSAKEQKESEGPCTKKALKKANVIYSVGNGLYDAGNYAAAAERYQEVLGEIPAECADDRATVQKRLADAKEHTKKTVDCSGIPNTESAWDAASERAYCGCIRGFVPSRLKRGCIKHPESQVRNARCPEGRIPQWDTASEQVLCYEDPYVVEQRRRGQEAAQQAISSMIGIMSNARGRQTPSYGGGYPSGPSMNNAQACAGYRQYLQQLCNSGDRSPQALEIARRTHDSAHMAQCSDPAIGEAYRCITGGGGSGSSMGWVNQGYQVSSDGSNSPGVDTTNR